MLSAFSNSLFFCISMSFNFTNTMKFNFHALFISCKQFLLNWKNSLKYENKWIYICLSIAIIPLTRNSLPKVKEI